MVREKASIMNTFIKTIKIIDPIAQSLILGALALSIDRTDNYQKILPALIVWQLLSSVFHFFISSRAKLHIERIIYFFLVILFLTIYLYTKNHIKEQYMRVFGESGPMNIPVYELFFVLTQGAFAVWYYLISIREISMVMKRIARNKGVK
jgi:hypothetical protein